MQLLIFDPTGSSIQALVGLESIAQVDYVHYFTDGKRLPELISCKSPYDYTDQMDEASLQGALKIFKELKDLFGIVVIIAEGSPTPGAVGPEPTKLINSYLETFQSVLDFGARIIILSKSPDLQPSEFPEFSKDITVVSTLEEAQIELNQLLEQS
jgi:hypothetical protein